jgi:hypothetical protein
MGLWVVCWALGWEGCEPSAIDGGLLLPRCSCRKLVIVSVACVEGASGMRVVWCQGLVLMGV